MIFKLNMFLISFVIILLAVLLQDIEACSCMRQHPQTHYCESDFVILARIKRERIVNSTKIYKVKIRKEYKMPEKAVVALKSGRLLTPAEGALCGVDLQVGRLYAISGKIEALRANVRLCNMVIPWENLSQRQRKGLKMMYSKGCTCEIKYCSRKKGCAGKFNNCNWTSDCEYREGICLRSRRKRCMWVKNQKLHNCYKNETLTISRLSG